MTKLPQTRELMHRVLLCTMHDVVETDGVMALKREAVAFSWAKIEVNVGSLIGKSGYAIEQPLEQRTHKIWMRYRTDLDITSAAWIFEQRRKSPPRWFKVLKVSDIDSQWYVIEARLTESSFEASPPVAKSTDPIALPQGIKL